MNSSTYYFCVFATLSELLYCVGMLYVVHRDGIYHHHSIIFSETIENICM